MVEKNIECDWEPLRSKGFFVVWCKTKLKQSITMFENRKPIIKVPKTKKTIRKIMLSEEILAELLINLVLFISDFRFLNVLHRRLIEYAPFVCSSKDIFERRYLPFELRQMFAQVVLKVENIWSGTLDNWEKSQSIN